MSSASGATMDHSDEIQRKIATQSLSRASFHREMSFWIVRDSIVHAAKRLSLCNEVTDSYYGMARLFASKR